MKTRALIIMALFFCHTLVNAEYYLYLMNNTNEDMSVMNTCDSKLSRSSCKVMHNGKLDAFKRVDSHIINYDRGITWNHHYTLRT
ncbi:MAG: hypothetical protein OXE99_05210, partial [Cellvibrionales bacterium]|nr:hypothetical protein [Cellvibrionales bacterium]